MKVKEKLILSSIIFVTFFMLKMAYQVLSLPDFGHGYAYVTYSDEGEYKVLEIYQNKVDAKKGISWKGQGAVIVLMNKQTKSIIHISQVPENYADYGLPLHTIFIGDATKELSDDYYTFDTSGDDNNVYLHPSLWRKAWRKLHIWLVLNWYDIDLNNINVKSEKEPFNGGIW